MSSSLVIRIDNITLFNPIFIGKNCAIQRQDEGNFTLTEFNVGNIQLETMLRNDEKFVTGEERLIRLRNTKSIRLGVRAFMTFWENKDCIPEVWKEKTNCETTYVHFDGTEFRHIEYGRCVLCIFWREDRWFWRTRWLKDKFGKNHPSAVLAI